MDQAKTLRAIMESREKHSKQSLLRKQPVEVIAMTSGKGGVGKSTITANLAIAMQKQGRSVAVLDGDFGLANLNIIYGVEATGSVDDVIQGRRSVDEIVLDGPEGVKLIPASSGLLKWQAYSGVERNLLLESLESAQLSFNTLIIDTGAGIGHDVTFLNSIAHKVMVVVTPEPTSIADAYALVKVMATNHNSKNFSLIVNQAKDDKEGIRIYEKFLDVCERFLSVRIEYCGAITYDRKVSESIVKRKPLLSTGHCPKFSEQIENISQFLVGELNPSMRLTGNVQYFWRSLLCEAHV